MIEVAKTSGVARGDPLTMSVTPKDLEDHRRQLKRINTELLS